MAYYRECEPGCTVSPRHLARHLPGCATGMDFCIECFHLPAVHGITGPKYDPCHCCEAPHVIAWATEPIPADARAVLDALPRPTREGAR